MENGFSDFNKSGNYEFAKDNLRMKHIWCEDSGAGYQFWNAVFTMLYDDFEVESKQSNSRLRKAVSKLEDDGEQYYVQNCCLRLPEILDLKRVKGTLESVSLWIVVIGKDGKKTNAAWKKKCRQELLNCNKLSSIPH